MVPGRCLVVNRFVSITIDNDHAWVQHPVTAGRRAVGLMLDGIARRT
jgi:hypothetical protein